MKKMMAIALAIGVVGSGLAAGARKDCAEKKECKVKEKACQHKEKALAEMSVKELKALQAKKVAALAAEKDEAKKTAIRAEIDSIKEALEAKGAKCEEKCKEGKK